MPCTTRPKSYTYYTSALYGLRRRQRLTLVVIASTLAHGILLGYAEHVRRWEEEHRSLDCCNPYSLFWELDGVELEPRTPEPRRHTMLRHVDVMPINSAPLARCSDPKEIAQVARLSFEWRSRSVEKCLEEHPVDQQLYGSIDITVTHSFVGTAVLSRYDTRLGYIDDVDELAQCMSDAVARMPLIGIDFCAMTELTYSLDVNLLPSSRHTAALSTQERYLRALRDNMPPPREDLYIPDSHHTEERYRKKTPEPVIVRVYGPTIPEQVARIEAAAEQRYDAAITQFARCETLLPRMGHVDGAFYIRHTYSHVGTLVSAHVVPKYGWRSDFGFYARCVDQMLQEESLHTSHFEAMTQVDYVVRLKE